MVQGILVLALLVWVPVLIYLLSRQGFLLILLWLLVAPIALNVLNDPLKNPFFGLDKSNDLPTSKGGYLTHAEATIKLSEVVQPTRILFGTFFLLFLAEAVRRRRRLGPFDATEKFAFVFSVFLIANALFLSRRGPFSLRVACDAFIIPLIAYFCARRLVTTEEKLLQLTRFIAYLGLYLITIGIVERLTLAGLFARVNGPFWSRNELYTIMVVVFFAVWLEIVRTRRGRSGQTVLPLLVLQFVLCLAPLIVLMGWGRGNLLGLISGIWIFLFFGRRLVDIRSKAATIGLILLLGPIIFAALYELTPQEIVESRVSRTSTIYARFGAWQNILEEMRKSPIVGIGLNNLRDVLEEKRTFVEGVKSETLAHNSFLSMAGELGLLGLFAYLAVTGSIVRTGLLLYQTGSTLRERWRGVTVISIMAAYQMAALFDTTLYFTSVSHVYVFVFTGAIAGLHPRGRSLRAPVTARVESHWTPKFSPDAR